MKVSTAAQRVAEIEAELEMLRRRAEPRLSDEAAGEALKKDLEAFLVRVERGEVQLKPRTEPADPETAELSAYLKDEIARRNRAQAKAEELRRWLPPRRFPDGHYH